MGCLGPGLRLVLATGADCLCARNLVPSENRIWKVTQASRAAENGLISRQLSVSAGRRNRPVPN